MALTYEESSALMQDKVFQSRVKVACINFANYIYLEPASTPGHSSRMRWAGQTMVAPDSSTGTVTPTVVMDPAVQEAGSTIDDAGLQSAVENSVNKLL